MIDVAYDAIRIVNCCKRFRDIGRGVNEKTPVCARKVLQAALGSIEVVDILLVVNPGYKKPYRTARSLLNKQIDRPRHKLAEFVRLHPHHRADFVGAILGQRLTIDFGCLVCVSSNFINYALTS